MFYRAKEVNDYLLKIKQGDKSQYEPLVAITALHLRGVAQYYLINKSLANDVVSEVFIKLLYYVDSYDCEQDGYNWMCRITQNLAYDHNQKEAKIAESEQRFARDSQTLACNHDFDEVEFSLLTAGLDETDRFIAYKKFVENRTLQDIGDELKISKAAVCNRIKKIGKIIYKNYKKK